MDFFDETAKKTSDMATAVLSVFQSQTPLPVSTWMPELMTDPEEPAQLNLSTVQAPAPKEDDKGLLKRRKSKRHSIDTSKYRPESQQASFERMVKDVHRNPDLKQNLLQREVEVYRDARKKATETALKTKGRVLVKNVDGKGFTERDPSSHPHDCRCVSCVYVTDQVLSEGVKNRRYSQTLIAAENAARLTKETSSGSMTAGENASFKTGAAKGGVVSYQAHHDGVDGPFAAVSPMAGQSRRRSLF